MTSLTRRAYFSAQSLWVIFATSENGPAGAFFPRSVASGITQDPARRAGTVTLLKGGFRLRK